MVFSRSGVEFRVRSIGYVRRAQYSKRIGCANGRSFDTNLFLRTPTILLN